MNALLADRMLEGLARRLRLLGYDCAPLMGDFRNDGALLAHVHAEGRHLLTTSRRLHALAPEEIILLPLAPLPAQVRAVARRFPIDFAARAFTRCSRDNHLLEAVPFAAVEPHLPSLVREQRPDPVWRCPACGRLYWPGTHTRRVARLMREWLGEELGPI